MKSKGVAIGLCCIGICGLGGLHDFYCGKIWLGVIKLLTCNFFLIGTLIDIILIACDCYYCKFGVNTPQPTYKTQNYTPTTAPATQPNRISDEGIIWQIGTDSQIDWAEDLVKKTFTKANNMMMDAIDEGRITDEERAELTSEIEEAFEQHDDANWWIDNRNEKTKDFLTLLLEGNDEMIEIIRKL